MKPNLLFIHGTGVRTKALATTLSLLRGHAVEFLPDWNIEACAWGDAFGAAPNRSGASVPDYDASHGNAAAQLAAQQRARWVLLADDPLIELRMAPQERVIGGAPGPAIWQRVLALAAHAPCQALVDAATLPGLWPAFIKDIEANAQWQAVINAISQAAAPASPLLARALVAALQARLRDQGLPALGVARRDALVSLLQPPLGGPPGGAALDWLLKRLTAYGRDHRGRITDITGPGVGDILRYQGRGGETLRKFIGERVQSTGARVLLAHSLGGIAAVDWLAMAPRPVDALVTVGSQAAYFYEIDALVSRGVGAGLPDFFPKRWLNIYDPSDMLGYPASGVFKGWVTDKRVDNGEPFPESHSAYFRNLSEVWPAVADFLKGA